MINRGTEPAGVRGGGADGCDWSSARRRAGGSALAAGPRAASQISVPVLVVEDAGAAVVAPLHDMQGHPIAIDARTVGHADSFRTRAWTFFPFSHFFSRAWTLFLTRAWTLFLSSPSSRNPNHPETFPSGFDAPHVLLHRCTICCRTTVFESKDRYPGHVVDAFCVVIP
jgi:hypothetical protein